MALGGIHLHGKTPLHFVWNTLTGVMYRDEIVRPLIIPTLQAMEAGATLLGDNTTAHRDREVNEVLEQQQAQRRDWSSRSPDLNPTVNCWGLLEHRIQNNHPPVADLQELSQILQQEWSAMPQQALVTLIRSIRQRFTENMAAFGESTHY